MDFTVKESRFQGREGGQVGRASLGEADEIKSSPRRSAESWFHSKSGKAKNGKGGRGTKSSLIK